MTMNAFSDRPDDPDAEYDDLDDLDEDEDEDEDCEEDALSVEFAIDQDGSRLAYVYTRGLWEYGIPELCVRLPDEFGATRKLDWGNLAFFLASGLIHLGSELIDVDHFTVPPYHGEFDGRPVQMWLDGQAPPEGPLAIALGEEVDTVLRVDCSLWHPSIGGED
jgi:hypothetical protein